MENNKQRKEVNKNILKTAIIISWVVLAICFIIKIFGGKIFNISTTNATFIKVCSFLDNHLWLQNIIAFCANLLTVSLLNMAVLQQKSLHARQFILVAISTAIQFACAIIGEWLNNKIITIAGFVFSFMPYFICPLILSRKILRSTVAVLLYLAFQSISIFIKGLAIIKVNSDSTLIALIYGVDLYIMLILYYLHANLIKDNKNKINVKGEDNNG